MDLPEIIASIDGQTRDVSYPSIADRFQGELATLGDGNSPERASALAEYLAFSFVEYMDDSPGQGPHYKPEYSFTTKDGSRGDFPALSAVTPVVLAYWEQRAGATPSDALRARYADLVWDLSKPATGKRQEVRFAQAAIDSSVKAVQLGLFEDDLQQLVRLKRALSISISTNDKARIGHAAQALVALEGQIGKDHLPGLCGFSFDTLVDNKAVALDAATERSLVQKLEARLARIAAAVPPDPPTIEAAMERLRKYYARHNLLEEELRVIRTYVSAVVTFSKTAEPLAASGWLDSVHELLVNRGLDDDAARIALLMREVEAKANANAVAIPFEIRIPIDEYNAELDQLFDAPRDIMFARFAWEFLVDRAEVEKQVKKSAAAGPLLSHLSISLRDEDGRAVASVGSVDDDLDGRVAFQMNHNLQLGSPFLRYALDRLVTKYALTRESILEYIGRSPTFPESRLPIISNGLQMILAGEHYGGLCILVPELEAALRRLLHLVGGNIYTRGRNGGTNLRNMAEILRDAAVVKALSEKVTFYFRVLLTDARGWNLRNVICHALVAPSSIGHMQSDRVIHALLFLGNLRGAQGGESGV